MKTHQEKFVPVFGMSKDEEEASAFAQRFLGIADMTVKVRNQLAHYADNTDNTSLRRQAETLRAWMDINSEGLAVAARAAQLGYGWMDEISARLEAASVDLDRIEREEMNFGGAAEPEAGSDLIKVWSEVNSILDSMEALYRKPAIAGETAQPVEPAPLFVR